MARISAQVILKTSDNIAANFVTNTYYFDLDEDSSVGNDRAFLTGEVNNALTALYEDMLAMFGGLQTTGHRIKYVDIDEPKPQYPYEERMFDFSAATDQNQLPSECCIVSSFEAEQTAGVNQASRRGRVFIGPIATSRKETDGRVNDGGRANIAAAFDTFSSKQDTAGPSGWKWVVYSRKLDSMSQVVQGHVDNAFDTQRRREVNSTARTVWS